MRQLRHAWLIGLLLGPLAPGAARAQVQGCDDDAAEVQGDFELTPDDRAEDVARNTPIVVRFAADIDLEALRAGVAEELGAESPVPCAGELVCVIESADGEAPRIVEAQRSIDDHTVRLEPVEPLAASTEHTVLIVQPGLDLIARKEHSFRTGSAIDRERPVLGYSADEVQVSVAELPPECGQPERSRRVILELPPATDDGDAESVELEIKLTSARGLDQPEVRARVRNEGDPVIASFVLGADEAQSRVCLSVRAIDALGRASQRRPRVCFNPSTRPVFESACVVSARPGSTDVDDKSGGAWAWSAVLLAALIRLRRRLAVGVPGKSL